MTSKREDQILIAVNNALMRESRGGSGTELAARDAIVMMMYEQVVMLRQIRDALVGQKENTDA